MTNQPTKRITIDAPSEATVLAARHLDATEGRVHVDTIVDASTRSAITTVLRYIAKAHNSPAAIPTRDEASRYDRLSPLARALVDDFDELDLAEMLVRAQDELAAHRAGMALDAPLRDQLQAAIKALGTSETILARIQALADEYPAGIDTALIHEALDTTAAPAATEATEHHYLSTGCLHDQHDYCSNVDGIAGLKKPAQCKFCTAPCQCPCHATTKEN